MIGPQPNDIISKVSNEAQGRNILKELQGKDVYTFCTMMENESDASSFRSGDRSLFKDLIMNTSADGAANPTTTEHERHSD